MTTSARRQPRPERPFRGISLPILVSLLILFVVAFPRKAPVPQSIVVLLGDSITAKWLSLDGRRDLSGLEVVNRGVPGDVTSLMLARFDRDVVELNPRVVVILGGTNDLALLSTASVEQNLAAMAELAERHGIRVVLATVPPAGIYDPEHPGVETPGHGRIEALNREIRSLAAKRRWALADYHAALSDHHGYYLAANLTVDGVHPSQAGYERMEPLLRQAVQEALARQAHRGE